MSFFSHLFGRRKDNTASPEKAPVSRNVSVPAAAAPPPVVADTQRDSLRSVTQDMRGLIRKYEGELPIVKVFLETFTVRSLGRRPMCSRLARQVVR